MGWSGHTLKHNGLSFTILVGRVTCVGGRTQMKEKKNSTNFDGLTSD